MKPMTNAMRTSTTNDTLATVLAVLAVTAATVNVVGGFLVTDRRLEMFRKPRRTGNEAEAGS